MDVDHPECPPNLFVKRVDATYIFIVVISIFLFNFKFPTPSFLKKEKDVEARATH